MPVGAMAGATAVAGIGSAVLGADAQRDASRQATEASRQATEAANQLTRETYGQNAARLDPIYQGGMRANSVMQGLLGIGGTTYGPALPGSAGAGALGPAIPVNNPLDMPDQRAGLQDRDAWASGVLQAMGLGGGGAAQLAAAMGRLTPQQQRVFQNYVSTNPDPDTVYEQRQAAYRSAHPNETAAANAAYGAQTPQSSAEAASSAFDTFRNSTDYQWRFNQGQKALEMSRLPGGGYDSGYTRRALIDYGGHEAAQEMGQYMTQLNNQMTYGTTAASALAGVGTNMANAINSANMGNATNAANAALARGTNTSNMYGSIAGSIGQAAGAFGSRNAGMYGGGVNPGTSSGPIMVHDPSSGAWVPG
jgi:hypothetical protein